MKYMKRIALLILIFNFQFSIFNGALGLCVYRIYAC